jgi:SAM-dependent methyltransferase
MYHSEDTLWWYIALRDILKYYLLKYATSSSAILDAGCGTGKNIEFFTSLGFTNIRGFDYSADAIEFCQKRGLLQVQTGNIIAIDYIDESFDIVCCMDVLGSLTAADRVLAVNELFRVLKPGGILLCNTASLEIFRSQHDDVANIKTRFTKSAFTELFNKENAEILKISYRVFLLSPLVLLFKIAKRVTKLFKSKNEAASDQFIFPFGLNELLLKIQLLDNKLFKRIDLPFGSSVFIVVRKKLG